MKVVSVTEHLNAMQRMFPSAYSDILRVNACCFWENQDRALDSIKMFATGWFERHHTGTRAALEATQRICKAETPVDLLREYRDWAGGVFDRAIADGLACQQQLMALGSALARPLASLDGENEAVTRRPSSGRARVVK